MSQSNEKDTLHEWADRHADWAKAQLAGIPVEQVEWDRDEVAHAAAAYEAGLEIGLRSGYQAGQHMGMANGLAAAERRAIPPGKDSA